ncbi:RAVE complex subunit Rav2 [Schizosaccharomyces japonicus yFS275]|uniref:RAVE complex subunit Rav2 n=1 Tax=Schizosaccharomyces japonicus (strain yFS275 / FY16936) TaxID=402676 RepID=B6K6V4_SCHJY|nr:RAVE complex subunit Rav2 [Schizosaccharomyces japonicus yFS275]EEB09258.1 RAVE complex subunit Rav2 [Schizosaccharomyces japonicus yFS275]
MEQNEHYLRKDEQKWFQENIVSCFYRSVLTELHEILDLLKSDVPNVLAYSSIHTDSIKGVVSRKQDHIDRVNLIVKLGKQVYEIRSNDGELFHLKQIQSLKNELHFCLYNFQLFKNKPLIGLNRLLSSLKHCIDLLNEPSQCFLGLSKSQVVEIPKNTDKVDSNRFFPSLCVPLARRSAFKPPLDPQITLSFTVSGSSIGVQVLRITSSAPAIDLNAEELDASQLLPYISQHVEAYSQDPMLLSVMTKLNALQKKTADMRYRSNIAYELA